ncbi:MULTISPECIES: hypothetical protein [unclassified Undibacterium]|uniref:hypothetical protein n=1 Tax=unclassified Undibacterium TaxID=2630295 RepID=UPI002AC9E9E0|nr:MULTISPECIES: hypothetical protein [unclassified Undibacterium]MEB0139746.1 hypothetical protein [Undibacterium sp. CCC2.1]MEB0172627.1 hypothetical protein [Undibacterium sp. CCC1.1]MEB0176392.1 hypothetical protein [Undibacterium sp. CCC3.4]MEB0215750.1 hypothetical protein [Undibacterium sp. 5I2]WPX45171.1 hypothetical protein RHM61_08115 [Undibacterium sp. CCC3.4]
MPLLIVFVGDVLKSLPLQIGQRFLYKGMSSKVAPAVQRARRIVPTPITLSGATFRSHMPQNFVVVIFLYPSIFVD